MSARSPRHRQRGAALILLAALVVLGISWMLVSALGNAARNQVADRGHNAGILREARAALVGWVTVAALDATEDNPGRLPCPQAWGDIGTANEGRAASFCAAPAAGLLPWRTLGLPKLLDSAGQQLWYVVSPGWHLPNSTTDLTINSNTAGALALDGVANAAVALIIAPGRPLSISPNVAQTAAGCAARSQSHAFGGILNPANFLECQNATTADFAYATAVVDNGTNTVLNDQVLPVTRAELLPGIEASIAKRIERDIVPPLRGVYATATWGLSSTNPVFPFAAPFVNPGPGGASPSSYVGTAGRFEGLLPFNVTQGCTFNATDPRCQPSLITWSGTPTVASVPATYTGGPILQSYSCSWESTDVARVCEGEYHEHDMPSSPIQVAITATFDNVAMGLRALDTTKVQIEARNDVAPGAWLPQTVSVSSSTMNSNGSATITFQATLPNIDAMAWGTYAAFRVRLERAVIGDHALLSATAATTGWFARNEWYRLVYYATAPGHSAQALSPLCAVGPPCMPTCVSGTDCLSGTNLAPSGTQRALLILAGRSLTNAARPNGTLGDYLDGANAVETSIPRFEQKTVNPVFNDRVLVVDANP